MPSQQAGQGHHLGAWTISVRMALGASPRLGLWGGAVQGTEKLSVGGQQWQVQLLGPHDPRAQPRALYCAKLTFPHCWRGVHQLLRVEGSDSCIFVPPGGASCQPLRRRLLRGHGGMNTIFVFLVEKWCLCSVPVLPPHFQRTLSLLSPVLPGLQWSQHLSRSPEALMKVPPHAEANAQLSALLALDPWQAGHSGPLGDPLSSCGFRDACCPGCSFPAPWLVSSPDSMTLGRLGAPFLFLLLTQWRAQAANVVHMPTTP